MQISLAEFQELTEMRENIRRTLEALELCWSCERVSECEPVVVDDGPPVWLCSQCAAKAQSRRPLEAADPSWSFYS